jgi:hypothetical protein
MLLHESVAVHVRVMICEVPIVQSPTVMSVKPMTGFGSQLSVAVAVPVVAGVVGSAQRRLTSGGQVITGGVVSATVIVCVQVAWFPQGSCARYVRVMLLQFAVPFVATSLTCVTIGTLQLSVAVTEPMFTGGTCEKHCTVTGPGHVIDGTIVSLTVIVCVHCAELPHGSVA